MDHNNEERPIVIRNTTDLQRLKLEKLMKNPDKPIMIPERPKGRSMPSVPDFVRNVMGSSAGAGSGEFHVYRHLRRKEYARQKFIQEKSERERQNDEYHEKIESNRKAAEDKTAKKRAKRLKKKIKAKERAKKPKIDKSSSPSEKSSSEHSDSEETNVRNENEFVAHDSTSNVNIKVETKPAECDVKEQFKEIANDDSDNECDEKTENSEFTNEIQP